VASNDTSAACCLRVVNSQNGPAPRSPRTGICGAGSSPKRAEEQKNKNRGATSKEVGPLPYAPPAPADSLSFDHAEGDYFPSVLASRPGLPAQVTLPVRVDRVSAYLRLS
jgi:hypothetical protein